ncbi:MAG: SH3 domain protein [Alphaproteobacteria bacterium]|jgi:SH3 domain protein
MLRFLIVLFFVIFSFSATALQSRGADFQPNANITDDLTTFIHTGSSRDYRIIGTILAGAQVTVLDRDGEPEFVQIVDIEGRRGWIEGQYLSSTGSIREQLPSLQEQVATLNQQLTTLREQHQQARSQSVDLEQQNKRIAGELEQALEVSAELQVKVDNADNTAMIEWFTRGGILAGVCILLGILITYFPKKRSRDGQWN